MEIGCRLILDALNTLPTPIPQPDTGDTYAAKLQKSEALIDWTQPAEQIERTIRAFNPFPTAYFMHGTERVKVFSATVAEPTTEPAGTVLDDSLRIACGQGTSLRLTCLQRPGKKVMPATEILKGWTLPKGTNLAV
jgi:methionyl-tRNA formyltransferase